MTQTGMIQMALGARLQSRRGKKHTYFDFVGTTGGAGGGAVRVRYDYAARTLYRGGGRKDRETVSIDEIADIRVEGQHGRSFAPGKALMLGVAGLTSKTSTAYLVVDGTTFQWRIALRGGCEGGAQQLIEKIVTDQRRHAAGLPIEH